MFFFHFICTKQTSENTQGATKNEQSGDTYNTAYKTLKENKENKYYSNKSKRRTTHTPPKNGGGGWVKPETREE